MGSTGTGTVFDFVTPRYTATRTHGYMGISQVYIAALASLFSCVFIVFLSPFIQFSVLVTFKRSLKLR